MVMNLRLYTYLFLDGINRDISVYKKPTKSRRSTGKVNVISLNLLLLIGKKRMKSVETVEIYDLLFDYLSQFPFPDKVKKRIDFNNLDSSCVNEAKFRYRNLPTIHEKSPSQPSDINETRPKTCIIFSSTFNNSTSAEQKNSLHAEKRTTATCRLQLTKTVTRNGNINLQIAPPNTMVQANGGFSKEKTVTSDKEEVMEEELSWSLDCEVSLTQSN